MNFNEAKTCRECPRTVCADVADGRLLMDTETGNVARLSPIDLCPIRSETLVLPESGQHQELITEDALRIVQTGPVYSGIMDMRVRPNRTEVPAGIIPPLSGIMPQVSNPTPHRTNGQG